MKVGHAGTLDPFATGLLLVLVGRATRVQRFLMALPKRYETVARLGWTSTTGDPEGEIAPGRMPRRAARAADRPRSASARRPTRRSRSAASARTRCARAGEAVELPEREVEVTRFEQLWREDDRAGVRDRVLVGHLRALADRRPRRRLLPRAAPHARSARSTSPTPTRSGDRAARRRARLPARASSSTATTPASAGARRRRPRRAPTGAVRLRRRATA